MARLKKDRLIQRSPSFDGFIPVGVHSAAVEDVILSLEEYEAFTLCDYEDLNHAEAAVLMGVSRPTFTRVYSSARKKIARAFVEAAPIKIEGGNASLSTRWFHCSGCGVDFNVESYNEHRCPLCGSDVVTPKS